MSVYDYIQNNGHIKYNLNYKIKRRGLKITQDRAQAELTQELILDHDDRSIEDYVSAYYTFDIPHR